MKVLNLYAGLGGNRKHWKDCEVTAVELDYKIAQQYQKFYPDDRVVMADAHKFLLDYQDEFDFVWSSPPCQSHSKMVKATRHNVRKYPDFKLYEEIVYLQNFRSGPWVVENVKPYYKPLIQPSKIIGRHYFWSNCDLPEIQIENHPNFIQTESKEEIESMKKWLGLEFEGNIYYKGNHSPAQVLRNCVHPNIGKKIFETINN